MRPRQRETRLRVIERCRLPGSRGVALRAIMIKIPRDVGGIRRPREIRLMTAKAIGRSAGKHIIAVAIRAAHRLMGACQGKMR